MTAAWRGARHSQNFLANLFSYSVAVTISRVRSDSRVHMEGCGSSSGWLPSDGFLPILFASYEESAEQILQRTAASHHCCNRRVSWPPSLYWVVRRLRATTRVSHYFYHHLTTSA